MEILSKFILNILTKIKPQNPNDTTSKPQSGQNQMRTISYVEKKGRTKSDADNIRFGQFIPWIFFEPLSGQYQMRTKTNPDSNSADHRL